MKTLVCTQPGELIYNSSAEPSLTKGRAIIKIKRVGVCGTDLHAFEGTQPYFNYPRVLGHELSGELVDADHAMDFNIGESVTCIPYFSCGKCIACRSGKPNCCANISVFGVHEDGAMKEYVSVPAASLVHGEGLSHDQLALIEPLAIGAHGVTRAATKKEEFVLVAGAGPIGLATMAFARLAGANVIALDTHQERLRFCKERSLAHHIIDASSANVAEQLHAITGGDMPSVVIDATGNLHAIHAAFRYLAHGGRYVLIGLQKGDICFSHPEFHKREATLTSSRNATRADFEQVVQCVRKCWIDATIFITHRVRFDNVKDEFSSWLDPSTNVIKAMIEFS